MKMRDKIKLLKVFEHHEQILDIIKQIKDKDVVAGLFVMLQKDAELIIAKRKQELALEWAELIKELPTGQTYTPDGKVVSRDKLSPDE